MICSKLYLVRLTKMHFSVMLLLLKTTRPSIHKYLLEQAPLQVYLEKKMTTSKINSFNHKQSLPQIQAHSEAVFSQALRYQPIKSNLKVRPLHLLPPSSKLVYSPNHPQPQPCLRPQLQTKHRKSLWFNPSQHYFPKEPLVRLVRILLLYKSKNLRQVSPNYKVLKESVCSLSHNNPKKNYFNKTI